MVLLFGPATASGAMLSDRDLNITLRIPDGFEPIPNFHAPPGVDIRYGYARPGRNGRAEVCIFIQRMGGTIGREPLSEDIAKKYNVARLCREKWKSFGIDGLILREVVDGHAFLTRNIQVPIKPNAIQLRVFGPESQEAELEDITRTLLASLDGPTNWLTTDERAEKLGEGVGRLLVWVVGIGAVVAWLSVREKKKFEAKLSAMGLSTELAADKIRPSWAWHLLGAYLIFGGFIAAGVFSAVVAMGRSWDRQGDMRKSLVAFVSGLVVGLTIIVITARRRAAARRQILCRVPLPPGLPHSPAGELGQDGEHGPAA